MRLAARKHGAKQHTGVKVPFAGVDPNTAIFSPLAPVSLLTAKGPDRSLKSGTGDNPIALSTTAVMAPPLSMPDYFAVGNYANSPLATLGAGPVTSITLVFGGAGYTAPTVAVTCGVGGVSAGTATPTLGIPGVITAIGFLSNGTSCDPNLTPATVTITDTTGSGAVAQAQYGVVTGGMRKFVDTLPGICNLSPWGLINNLGQCIPLASKFATPPAGVPANGDYYEIGLTQYSRQLHSDLPPTTLRGYTDRNPGSSSFGINQYLGPLIVATKDRPVRVKFTNSLGTLNAPVGNGPGANGNLFIPVDTTYMGAGNGPNGQPYTQNRATLHLHGGATAWISDGTPHQWITPAADTTTLPRGLSQTNVPDMPTPPVGSATFLWTNQQGDRLMFYHDHAYGITRLNVYAGEAAGYLLVDPVEETGLAAATVPGTIVTDPITGNIVSADLAHLVPLVLQDKTFVPDNGISGGQLAAQDPTWDLTNFGGKGNLWFPHVYTPNQDPNDPLGGANAYGRWDYGPWFFPPQTTLTAATPNTAVTTPCTSAAFPGTLQSTPACPTCGCPITPNPSGTPEGFMDTPVINGTAYPILHVAPAAYRFRILAAGNDRSWHLSLFVADATGKDVTMLPSVPPAPGTPLPLCSQLTPITQPGLDLGLATALFDATGNPLNGTGLPANCWPNYGPQSGIPVKQSMWAADGRVGGVPDPRTAGPPWIQIGSEGGLLPTPQVIPAAPVNYEWNTRSITITNVGVHGLWLGPAERADVIVDFSKFAGKTLILFNDAPTPAPAFDSRLDYFTGDGDQSLIGGAPNTLPGYGPNTRTIMQIVVDGTTGNTVPFSLPTLMAAFASTATTQGLFASTQPTTIVPEPSYDSAYNAAFPPAFTGISDNTLTFTPMSPLTLAPCPSAPTPPAQCVTMNQKAIQELFTLDYGRMNATLGTELPLTSFLTQTTIPLGYVDPSTEIFKEGDTQVWKITHNGVDTHFIHFHLFNVQVINRMGWDGTIRPPDENETGWKDTVRMNPLEDITVALQPIKPIVPFPLPDSLRPMDVTTLPGTPAPPETITQIDPFTNLPASIPNAVQNFGWEYVWHCHILGHEENDMMRPMVFQVAPPAPSNLTAIFAPSPGTGVDLTWTDNSANETSFTLERAAITDPAFSAPTSFTLIPSIVPNTAFGGTITFNDPTAVANTQYFYRVQAVDDNFSVASGFAQSFNATPALLSGWSNTASISTTLITPTVTFTGAPATAAYNSSFLVTATTNASTMPTITGTAGVCTVGPVTGTPLSATATVAMTSGAGTCTLTASWAADATFLIGTATQTTTAALASPTVSFTGAPATAPYQGTFTVTATTNAGVMPTISGLGVCTVSSPPGGTPAAATATVSMTSGTGTCTLTASWLAPGPAPTYSAAGPLTQSTTATKITPTVSFTGAPASAVYNTSFAVTATTTAADAASFPNITGTGVCTVGGPTGSFLSTNALVTMISGTGTCTLTATWAATTNYLAAGPINPSPNSPTTAAKAASATSITAHSFNPSLVGQAVTVNFSVTGTTPPTGSVTVTATTGETCIGSLSGGTGSCQLTFLFSGDRTMTATYGGDANFNGSTSPNSTNQAVWDFAMGVNPGAQTVNGGQKASYTLTVSSLGGFAGTPVNLTCSVPAAAVGYSCAVAPTSVTPNGGSKNATVTVTTVKGSPGTYTLTFTGTTSLNSFTVIHLANPTLTVTK